jgi:hypothetical protein
VRVDAVSGAVLVRARVPEDSALLETLDSLREDVWLSDGEVIGLATWPESVERDAKGKWTFGVARPVRVAEAPEEPQAFAFETVTREGPCVRSRPRYLGMIAPGTALYHVYKDGLHPAQWIAVRG